MPVECFFRPLKVGDVVSVELDLKSFAVRFGLNGVWNSAPTFCDVAHTSYRLLVNLPQQYAVTLVGEELLDAWHQPISALPTFDGNSF